MNASDYPIRITTTATVETEFPLTINEGNIVRAAAARINAEQWGLSVANCVLDGPRLALNTGTETAPWFVYRGGSHVALIKDGERILLVTENRPQPAPTTPETTNDPAPEPLPVVTAALGYGTYGFDMQEAKTQHERVKTFIAAVNAEEGRSLYDVEAKFKAAFKGWHVERLPGLLLLARTKHSSPVAVFSQALTAIEADVKAGDQFDVWVNQGLRDGTVLATIGRRYLVEYEMPKGTTALLAFTVGIKDGGKNVAYGSCPAYWLQAIVDAGQEWIGNGQGRRMLGGVKAALAAKKAGR